MNIHTKNAAVPDFFEPAKAKPKKLFLIAPDSLSFKDATDEIGLVMRLFEKRGLKKGDVILLCIENDADLVVFLLAAFRYGLVTSILAVDNTSVEVQALVQHVQPRAVVCSADILDRWKAASVLDKVHLSMALGVAERKKTSAKRLRSFLGSSDTSADDAEVYPGIVAQMTPLLAPQDEPALSDFAMLVFTSGSTGTPKVVRLTYDAVLTQANRMRDTLGLTSGSVMLNMIPFTSLGAAASGALLSFMNGSTLVRPVRKFSNQAIPDLLDTIYSKRITHFFLSPAMMQLLLRYGENLKETFDTDDFVCFLSMSAMLPQKVWEDFEEKTGKEVVNSYGLSEANNLTFSGPKLAHRDTNSVGKISVGEWKIVDGDGNGLDVGEVGELVVSGPTVMTDYVGDTAETGAALADGWFKTGDLARHDGDGNIFIAGRRKDVVIVGGNNVYPEEVDDNIRLCPGVHDTCSMGIDDSIMGEILVSCVVRKDDTLNAAGLISHLSKRISPIKLPAKVVFVDEIPLSERGKADRNQLRKQVTSELGLTGAGDETSLETQIISIAAETFMIEASDLDTNSNYSNTLGWDSLGHVIFVEALGSSFDVEIEPMDVLRIHTIADAVDLVEKKLSEQK